MNANIEIDAGHKTFASGLLPDLIAALRRSREGDLVAVISADPRIGPEMLFVAARESVVRPSRHFVAAQ
jgi:hypothetical protein